MSLALNQTTSALLATWSTTKLPQSLLLTGESGVGLFTIANKIAHGHELTLLRPQNTKQELDANGTITIERIRELYTSTRSKHTSMHLVIVDDADRMSISAQTAFLKLLEEPGRNVHFLLTTHQSSQLLPTIRSRVQTHYLPPISHDQSIELLSQLKITEQQKKAQLLFIAEGLPAELTRLSQDEAYFNVQVGYMTDARSFLQAPNYEKLLVAHKYRDNRSGALKLLIDAEQIARRTLQAKPQPQLIRQLETLLQAYQQIGAGGNVRLQLAACVL